MNPGCRGRDWSTDGSEPSKLKAAGTGQVRYKSMDERQGRRSQIWHLRSNFSIRNWTSSLTRAQWPKSDQIPSNHWHYHHHQTIGLTCKLSSGRTTLMNIRTTLMHISISSWMSHICMFYSGWAESKNWHCNLDLFKLNFKMHLIYQILWGVVDINPNFIVTITDPLKTQLFFNAE